MPKQRLLIKKGTPHPTLPKHKFESAHLDEDRAEGEALRLLDKPKIVSTTIASVPEQHLVYARKGVTVKIVREKDGGIKEFRGGVFRYRPRKQLKGDLGAGIEKGKGGKRHIRL